MSDILDENGKKIGEIVDNSLSPSEIAALFLLVIFITKIWWKLAKATVQLFIDLLKNPKTRVFTIIGFGIFVGIIIATAIFQ